MLMTGCGDTNQDNEKDKGNHKEQRRKARERELYDMFYVFDKDRSGYISSKELSDVMKQFGHLSDAEVNIMLAGADIDGDGQVKICKC